MSILQTILGWFSGKNGSHIDMYQPPVYAEPQPTATETQPPVTPLDTLQQAFTVENPPAPPVEVEIPPAALQPVIEVAPPAVEQAPMAVPVVLQEVGVTDTSKGEEKAKKVRRARRRRVAHAAGS